MKKRRFTATLCLIQILCFAFFFVSASTIKIEAQTNTDNFTPSTVSNKNNISYATCTGGYIILETEEYRFEYDETFTVSYLLSTSGAISDVDYTQTGFSTASISIDKNNDKRIIVELLPSITAEEHSLQINVILENGDTLTGTLYAISNKCGVFISQFATDTARRKYMSYALEEGVITQEEYDSMEWDLSQADLEQEMTISSPLNINGSTASVNAISGQKITVKCTILWRDVAENAHPLRGVKVEVREYDSDSSTQLLATTHTNELGQISCEVDVSNAADSDGSGYDIFVRVYAGDDNAMVKINNTNNSYYSNSSVAYNISAGITISNTLTYKSTGTSSHSMQISQAVLTARNYAAAMMGRQPSAISVQYPQEKAFYSGTYKKIMIPNLPGKNNSPNSYASWDMIMHEYGHHIQHELGFTDDLGLEHASDENHADEILKKIRNGEKDYTKYTEDQAKDLGVLLAWREAWPTVFALMAQQYYLDDLEDIVCYVSDDYGTDIGTSVITYVANVYYDAYNVDRFSLEKISEDSKKGEACEEAIMGVLWDLYDNVNDTVDNDTISLGHQAFWDISTQSGIYTFSDFIEAFYDEYPQYVDDIASNLTKYNMASTAPTISTSGTSTNPPSLTWTAQGGSTHYTNNSFSIIFFSGTEDEDGINAEIARTPFTTQIEPNLTPYFVPEDIWEKVLCSKETSYYIAIASRQTDSPTTGEYISQWIGPFPTPILPSSESFVIPANTRYTEKIATIPKGDTFEYNISFVCGGMNIIQTFGRKDAVMTLYDANGNEIARSDDDGQGFNSLISYSFASGAQYKIVVRFYSSTTFGKVKLAITPAYGESVSGNIEDYENIAEYETATSTGLMTILDLFNTRVFLFKPLASGEYTFEIFSSFDTYIYVIDPRSTDQLVEDEDYNDDSEDSMDARLTIYLEANVQYFVIYSDYAPNDMFESYDIIIHITKED